MHHKHYTGDLTIDKLPDVSGYDKDGNFVLVIREGDMNGDIGKFGTGEILKKYVVCEWNYETMDKLAAFYEEMLDEPGREGFCNFLIKYPLMLEMFYLYDSTIAREILLLEYDDTENPDGTVTRREKRSLYRNTDNNIGATVNFYEFSNGDMLNINDRELKRTFPVNKGEAVSLASGDLNNDGIDDLIVGEGSDRSSESTRPASVTVYHVAYKNMLLNKTVITEWLTKYGVTAFVDDSTGKRRTYLGVLGSDKDKGSVSVYGYDLNLSAELFGGNEAGEIRAALPETLTVTGETLKYESGTMIKLTAVPYSGYKFDHRKLGNRDVEQSTLSFTMPSEAIDVKAFYKEDAEAKRGIVIVDETFLSGGSVKYPEGYDSGSTYPVGKQFTFTAVDSKDSVLDHRNMVKGKKAYNITSRSITVTISETPIILYPVFTGAPCKVTLGKGISAAYDTIDAQEEAVTIRVSSGMTVPKGTVLKLAVTGKDGAAWYINGKKQTTAKTKCTYTVNADVTIEYKSESDIPEPSDRVPTLKYEQGSGSVKLTRSKVQGAEAYGIVGYVNGKWELLDSGTGNSYTLKKLKAGTKYKIAVIAKFGGKWNKDYSNAVTVTAGEASGTKYPVVSAQVSGEQFRLKWTAVSGAEKYGIAVYQSGRWRTKVQLGGSVTSYTSPKMSRGTYKLVVCAKVNGKWDTSDISGRAVTVKIA
ncbi:MAG: hypothetical protein K6B74_08575 [Ruminococcus sp.]|nr:hypothetical protein [Ruminococcus sp.]